MQTKVLFVDDDPRLLDGVRRVLGKRFEISTALGPAAGMEYLTKVGPFAVVVADMRMPGTNGVEFLERSRRIAPDTVRVMLTGDQQLETATAAVNSGQVFRFLVKPCPPDTLAIALEAAAGQYRVICTEREILSRTLNGVAKAFSEILSTLHPTAFGFGRKLREYTVAYAKHLNFGQIWDLELAAMLCQVGYVTIPPLVMAKARANLSLNTHEREMLERVPLTGSELLANIPRLDEVARTVRYRAKNFDGSGYPADEIAGEAIPVGARLLRVLTDLIALEEQGLCRTQALSRMQTTVGIYDPQVLKSVSACFDVFMPEAELVVGEPVAVSVKSLRTGQRLARNVETSDGTVILDARTPLTPVVLERLRNFATTSTIREPILIQEIVGSKTQAA